MRYGRRLDPLTTIAVLTTKAALIAGFVVAGCGST
jgi:hypothetical protein